MALLLFTTSRLAVAGGGDNDPVCFLTYLIAALQTIEPNIGEGILGLLQTTQLPPIESIVTTLINEMTVIRDHFILVLDDYHVIAAGPIDHAITLLIERMPPQMHLIIVTRKNPRLPLARLRVRDQLTEVNTAHLRFTSSEAAEFLGEVMELNLSSENVALLESRTEGWIAGLQLAALSMQGHKDPTSFIQSFTGSHRFLLDYLVEEVLQQQSASVRSFLLHTSILDRLCGPLCDAILRCEVEEHSGSFISGQDTLEYLEHANLFLIPLDNERRWYRYHHLFADLLKKQLHQSIISNSGNDERVTAGLHVRASIWYENHNLAVDSFHHAVAAKDIERAARLMEGDGMPLIFRGAVAPVIQWLDSIPNEEMDARPSLWVMYASVLLMVGRMTEVEQKLQAAEKALQGIEQDNKSRDLIGHVASIRATLAVSKHEVETIITESHRALDYLRPDNLPVRTATIWTLGYAYQLQGERAAAGKAYAEALSISQKIGHVMITILATLGIGNIEEAANQLYEAAESYRRVLDMAGNPPLPVACEAHLGLARILYEWNDLDASLQHIQQAVQLAKQFERTDRGVASEVFLARLMLVRGELSTAAAILARANHHAQQQQFVKQLPYIAALQVLILLHEGSLAQATHLAQKDELPISQARVYLAQGDTSAALTVLEPLREQAEARGLEDERLKVMVIQAVALHAHGEKLRALQLLAVALMMAEPGGFIRTFVDEGILMYRLLCEAANHEMMPTYLVKLLSEFKSVELKSEVKSDQRQAQFTKSLIEPLSGRELEVLRLIAEGLSNREISERLFIALSTVKGHTRIIFDKLQVGRRTEAVARAREWNLL